MHRNFIPIVRLTEAVRLRFQAEDEMDCLFKANEYFRVESLAIDICREPAAISYVFPLSGRYVKLTEKGREK
ncbi:hypothetical protein CQ062_10885 [Ochrobactrum sp. MYb68]|nr:hypothetical protein CQ062_10885 [Ochrobactrum sp. MYb68]